MNQPLLRRTLPGEYLSLALIVHATFGSFLWAAWSLGAPTGLLMVTAGLWIIARASGMFAHRTFSAFVTFGLTAATLVWQQYVELTDSYLWFFSPSVFVAMLSIVLCSDVVECFASPLGSRLLSRSRGWNWYRIAIWALGFAFLVYMVAIPTVGSIVEAMQPTETSKVLQDEMSLSEKVRLRSMEAMTGLVFFALGATIGSFLNVVVFRMPRGESVVSRPSRCPQCETEIKGRDNVPIFGWLLLNGRCRACQTSISPRYPIVESITATIFLLLFFVELISGGANLPLRRPNFHHGVVWIIFYTKWDLIAIYLFHCFSLSTLLTWALVDVDRQRLPLWARWCVCGILLALPAMMTDLLPVPWQAREFGFNEDWKSVLQTAAIGGVCGAVLGWLVLLVTREPVQQVEPDSEDTDNSRLFSGGHTISASIIVGLSVGWQAAIGVWLIALALWPIICWVASQWSMRRPPVTAVLLSAYLIHLVCWRSLNTGWWPSYEATPGVWILWCVGFIAMCVANRLTAGEPALALKQ